MLTLDIVDKAGTTVEFVIVGRANLRTKKDQKLPIHILHGPRLRMGLALVIRQYQGEMLSTRKDATGHGQAMQRCWAAKCDDVN